MIQLDFLISDTFQSSYVFFLQAAVESQRYVGSATKDVMYNPKYEELFALEFGPQNPFQMRQQHAHKNMPSSFVEPTYINNLHFENQHRTFISCGM
jgi:pre-mRNA-processing factor 17